MHLFVSVQAVLASEPVPPYELSPGSAETGVEGSSSSSSGSRRGRSKDKLSSGKTGQSSGVKSSEQE